MDTYRPSPALDLQEFLTQEEDRLKTLGLKVLPMGALVMLTAVPADVDWPVLSDEERLSNLLDTLDILDQQRTLVEEEIAGLRRSFGTFGLIIGDQQEAGC
jgi:hypothetical protein